MRVQQLILLVLGTLAAAGALSSFQRHLIRPSGQAVLSARASTRCFALVECNDASCNFESEVVKAEGFTVVDFYANWCGPCKIAAKTFKIIAEEFPDKSIKFVKVDTEVHEDTVDTYGLKGLPVFGIFKNGQMVKKHEGNIGKDKLLKFIEDGIKEFA